jgi:hypothetical protein
VGNDPPGLVECLGRFFTCLGRFFECDGDGDGVGDGDGDRLGLGATTPGTLALGVGVRGARVLGVPVLGVGVRGVGVPGAEVPGVVALAVAVSGGVAPGDLLEVEARGVPVAVAVLGGVADPRPPGENEGGVVDGEPDEQADSDTRPSTARTAQPSTVPRTRLRP